MIIDVHIGLELGRLIQQTRTQKGMSQKDVAAVSVISTMYSIVSIVLLYRRLMRRQ